MVSPLIGRARSASSQLGAREVDEHRERRAAPRGGRAHLGDAPLVLGVIADKAVESP